MPQIKSFDGFFYPVSYIQLYQDHIEVTNAMENLMFKIFPLTLVGLTREWYDMLRPKSIQSFEQLCLEFVTKF